MSIMSRLDEVINLEVHVELAREAIALCLGQNYVNSAYDISGGHGIPGRGI